MTAIANRNVMGIGYHESRSVQYESSEIGHFAFTKAKQFATVSEYKDLKDYCIHTEYGVHTVTNYIVIVVSYGVHRASSTLIWAGLPC